jgi:hypothetical protein
MGPVGSAAFAGKEYTGDGKGFHEAPVAFHRRCIRDVFAVCFCGAGGPGIAAQAFKTAPSLAEGRAVVAALEAEATRAAATEGPGAAGGAARSRSLPPAWVCFTPGPRGALTDAT